MFYALICINNHVFLFIICMLSSALMESIINRGDMIAHESEIYNITHMCMCIVNKNAFEISRC